MRTRVKFRLFYLLCMAAVFGAGFTFMPEALSTKADKVLTFSFLAAYFIALPALYWFCVILKGEEKRWKIIIPLSLGTVIARYTLPSELAEYFDFISYVRYPIIAILLLIELAVIAHVVSMLWKARHTKGDPRVKALSSLTESEDKKRSLALMMAAEPACWYYMIPKFSRNHTPKITDLTTLSKSGVFMLLLLAATLIASVGSYLAIVNLSELAAIIVSSLILYSVFSVVANYRIAKHYSVYLYNDHLVINDSFLNLLLVPLSDINSVSQGTWEKSKETVTIGRGDVANVQITCTKQAQWHTLMGTFLEHPETIQLIVSDPQALVDTLETQRISKQEQSEMTAA